MMLPWERSISLPSSFRHKTWVTLLSLLVPERKYRSCQVPECDIFPSFLLTVAVPWRRTIA